MEESITAVDTHQKPLAENLPATIPPTAPISTFTKVDNNLTGIGFFTASSKRSRKETKKETVVIHQGVEHRVAIIPSAEYGLPITQDQDYWLALMKLVTDYLQQEGKLANPFTFTTADILKILGHQLHNGKNYKAVQEWADVMSFTGIKGGAYDVVRKRWIVDRTHAVERFITVGKELPDGTIADKNHIWFSQWQLDNINSGNLIAVELTTYTQLENNISKNLVPHLQEWLYASQRDGRFEKQYEDICQLLGVRTYRYRSQIEEQFSPSLNELTTHGYISKWAIEPMAFRKHFKLVLWHGRKYHSDRQVRLSKKPQPEILTPGATTGESIPARRPRQRHLNLAPVPEPQQTPPTVIIDYNIVAELEKRGVGGTDARKLLATLKPGQPILDQLEYGDLQIEQSKGKITNPPGFYISLLQRDVPVPATFETSRTRNARERAEKEQRQAFTDRQAAALAQEEAERQKLDAQIAALPAEARLALLAQAKADLLTQHPGMAVFFKTHPESAVEDGSVKVRMRNLVAEGWQPPKATPQPENPHYAIKPDIRQAAPLQETAPVQTVVDQPQPAPRPADEEWDTPFSTHLNLVLSTLQLSAPLATAAVVVEPWNRPLDTRKN
jgi:hypothetical protein